MGRSWVRSCCGAAHAHVQPCSHSNMNFIFPKDSRHATQSCSLVQHASTISFVYNTLARMFLTHLIMAQANFPPQASWPKHSEKFAGVVRVHVTCDIFLSRWDSQAAAKSVPWPLLQRAMCQADYGFSQHPPFQVAAYLRTLQSDPRE